MPLFVSRFFVARSGAAAHVHRMRRHRKVRPFFRRMTRAATHFFDGANARETAGKYRFRTRWRRHLARDCAIARVTCKKAGENVSCRLRIDKVFVYFMRLQMRALKCGVF
ncbi:hypothetical protein G3257_25795 [Janthinobacterium lividum]|uniref:hypothetical protein n=1 Tax=Janthinobacterium lividum TaxID=29581 RepID=UPI001595A08B|nr:hypothetical protein [Janthinobacterium lividum]QKY05326.1 hypothetical protein G3257_25795 [Janthinobacterium lividum]